MKIRLQALTKRRWRKIISIFLSVCMVSGMFLITATSYADESMQVHIDMSSEATEPTNNQAEDKMLQSALGASAETKVEIDISEGDVTILDGTNSGTIQLKSSGRVVDNLDPTTTNIVISGETTEHIVIIRPTNMDVKVTLAGVKIQESNRCAFNIWPDVKGAVTVTLQDETENILVSGAMDCAGLQKANEAKLTIQRSNDGDKPGSLTATGGGYAAGIGGGRNGTGSNIKIEGGTVTATGGYGGAGIGGGNQGNGDNITISGGTVTATTAEYSEDNAAGIGGGSGGTGSNITITGGTVTAAGGSGGAGIGGGSGGTGSNIKIEGGTVTATGGSYAAGIGGSRKGAGSEIAISGGTVTAAGGTYGAGIGSGGTGSGSGGTGSGITISGGTVEATGGSGGAGIGGGNYTAGSGITISGGTVTATGGSGGAGIGGGSSADAGTGEDITISGGTVTATGNNGSAGIGGGNYAAGSGITISGGTVTATGAGKGAGIGGGGNADTSSSLKVTGGNIKASSFSVTPTNDDGVNVYKTTFTVPKDINDFKLEFIKPNYYKTNDITMLDTRNVYCYLPASQEAVLKCNDRIYKTTVTTGGSAKFSQWAPAVGELTVPDPIHAGETLTLTAPEVTNDGNTFQITSQGWEISKTIDERVFKPFNPNTQLDETYHKAKLRYAVSYSCQDIAGKTYSNEVTVSVKKDDEVEIQNDLSKIYDGKSVDEPVVSHEGTGRQTITYYQKNEVTGTYDNTLSNAPSAVGKYKVVVTIADDEDYFIGSAEQEFSIDYLTVTDDSYTIEGLNGATSVNGWFNGSVAIKPTSENWQIGASLGTYRNSLTVSKSVEQYEIYLKNEKGQMTAGIPVTIQIDTQAPTDVTIEVDNNTFKEFLRTIAFNLFFKETRTVTITANDNEAGGGSGVDQISYYIAKGDEADEKLSNTDLEGKWKTYHEDAKPQLSPSDKYVVYAKATDKAGNESLPVNTDGLIFDNEPPKISGIKNDVAYTKGTVEFTVTENLSPPVTVKANGTELTPDETGYYTLTDDLQGDITITATDEAGNETSVLIHVKENTNLEINNELSKIYDGDPVSVEYESSSSGDKTVEYYKWNEETKKYDPLDSAPSAVGKYKVVVTVAATDYYFAGRAEQEFSIDYLTVTDDSYTITAAQGVTEADGWFSGSVLIKPTEEGWQIGTELGTYQEEPLTVPEDVEEYAFYLMNEKGQMTDAIPITIQIDTTAPNVAIDVKGNIFKEFLNTITFGYFFQETQEVQIIADDADSRVGSIYYYLADEALTEEQLQSAEWIVYDDTAKPQLSPNNQYVVYAKAADKVGNESDIVNTDGLVFDNESSGISGSEEGGIANGTTKIDGGSQVNTGDENGLLIWIVPLLVSGGIMITLSIRRDKKRGAVKTK